MPIVILQQVIQAAAQVLIWVVIAAALLSFFLSPYHPVRQALDRLVDPMLRPIRRLLPASGGLDFSPLVLILLIEVAWRFLVRVLSLF